MLRMKVLIRACFGLAATAVWLLPVSADAYWNRGPYGGWRGPGWGYGGGVFIGVAPPPIIYGPPLYYSAPVYYPPVYAAPPVIVQPPLITAAPPPGAVAAGQFCNAGPFVCPSDGPARPLGSVCSCPTNGRDRAYGTIR